MTLVQNAGKERLGYTQKPEALLERIISASSNEGEWCWTPSADDRSQRRSDSTAAFDITHIAITLIRHRLRDIFKDELKPYAGWGSPRTLPAPWPSPPTARTPGATSSSGGPWASWTPAPPRTGRRAPTQARLDEYTAGIIVQVKSGHVDQIATLKGDMDRDPCSSPSRQPAQWRRKQHPPRAKASRTTHPDRGTW